MSSERPIRIVTISGSVRPGNFTSKALAIVNQELGAHDKVSVDTLDPAQLELAMPGLAPTEDAKRIQALLKEATGVVLATPEYHGSFSSVIKLVIENLGFPSELATKPVALLGVAAGQIGAIKSLESLRGVVSHVGGIVLPGPVSVAGVQGVFDESGACTDAGVERRLRGLATALIHYIEGAVCPKACLEAMVREGVAT
jgi:chromate reductase, NAD(P)H dehydrogenase (quinone)